MEQACSIIIRLAPLELDTCISMNDVILPSECLQLLYVVYRLLTQDGGQGRWAYAAVA